MNNEKKALISAWITEFEQVTNGKFHNLLEKKLSTLKYKSPFLLKIMNLGNPRYKTEGTYNQKKHSMTLEIKNEESSKETFFHELLHVLSANNEQDLGGFKINESNSYERFDEGATQIILGHYFPKYMNENTYPVETKFANIIASYIGYSKFEELYFNKNITELIKLVNEKNNEFSPNPRYMNIDFQQVLDSSNIVFEEYSKMIQSNELLYGKQGTFTNPDFDVKKYLKNAENIFQFTLFSLSGFLIKNINESKISQEDAIYEFNSNMSFMYERLIYGRNNLGEYFISPDQRNYSKYLRYTIEESNYFKQLIINKTIDTEKDNDVFHK